MAGGVNPLDVYTLTGNYRKIDFPYTPGVDGAGIVDKVGENITSLPKVTEFIYHGA